MAGFKPKVEGQQVISGPEQRQTWKSKSRQHTSQAHNCPHCGADIEAGYAICPHCGRSLTPDKCSFCGAAMKASAKFCTHCGQPRTGIVCPECGTLNSRNFCRKCNAPLTEMAQLAMSAAKADPAFITVQKKAEELAELHGRIEALKSGQTDSHKPVNLSDSDKALLDEYAAILGQIGAVKPQPKMEARPKYDDTVLSLDEIMEAYRGKAAEMDAALAALAPPPDFTPEQQRDYYCARKIVTVHTEYDMSDYSPTSWVCNYCGAMHNNPSECAEPQLGGRWVYTSPEEYIRQNRGGIIKSQSLNIE